MTNRWLTGNRRHRREQKAQGGAAGTGAEGMSKGSIHPTKRASPHCMLTHAKHQLPRWTQSSDQLMHRLLRPRWSLQLLLFKISGTGRILTPATPPASVHVFSYGYKWFACSQSLELCRWRQTGGSGAVLLKHACSVKYVYSWWNFTVRGTSLPLIICEFCKSEVLMTVWGLQVVFIKGLFKTLA